MPQETTHPRSAQAAEATVVTPDTATALRTRAESVFKHGDQDARHVAQLVLRGLDRPNQTVRRVFGLAQRHGGESPQRTERRRYRNEALRALAEAEAVEGNLDVEALAARVVAKLRRYERDTWPRDRRRGAAASAQHALHFRILESGLPLLGTRWMVNVLKLRE
jgi:hypothetical protein